MHPDTNVFEICLSEVSRCLKNGPSIINCLDVAPSAYHWCCANAPFPTNLMAFIKNSFNACASTNVHVTNYFASSFGDIPNPVPCE